MAMVLEIDKRLKGFAPRFSWGIRIKLAQDLGAGLLKGKFAR